MASDSSALRPYDDVSVGTIRRSSRWEQGCVWKGFIGTVDRLDPFSLKFAGSTEHLFIANIGPTAQLSHTVEDLKFSGKMKPNDVLFVPAGHSIEWQLDTPATAFSIRFESDFLTAVAELNGVDPNKIDLRPKLPGTDRRVQFLAASLQVELELGGPNGGLFASSIATALCQHALRSYATRDAGPFAANAQHELNCLQRARDFIHAHFMEEIYSKDLAANAGVRLTRGFSRQFEQKWGLAPIEYQHKLRIEHGMRLLEGGERYNLAELAIELGYSHQSHLSNWWKRLYQGQTPEAFRAVAQAKKCKRTVQKSAIRRA